MKISNEMFCLESAGCDGECGTVMVSDSECGVVLEGVYSCVTVPDK